MRTKKQYREYLQSPAWQSLRKQKDTRRCEICKQTGEIHVHHLFYRKDLGKTKRKELRPLCRRCHIIAHFLIRIGKLRLVYTSKPARQFRRTRRLVKEAIKNHIHVPDWKD